MDVENKLSLNDLHHMFYKAYLDGRITFTYWFSLEKAIEELNFGLEVVHEHEKKKN